MESVPIHTSSRWIILYLNPFPWRHVQSGSGRVELFLFQRSASTFYLSTWINCCWWVLRTKQTLQTAGSQVAKWRSSSKGIAKHSAPAARLLWEKLGMKIAKIKLNGLPFSFIWSPITSTSVFQTVFLTVFHVGGAFFSVFVVQHAVHFGSKQ